MGDNSYKFQKLTPINDVELGVYKNAIDFVFDNNDLKNIAISGQYSAGKSSLVESYKKSQPQIKFVHISLAHFRAAEQTEASEHDLPINETALEGKILNQLIHQINPDNIPQTNFKVKKKVTSKVVAKNTFFIVLFIAMILHITLFDKWHDFVSLLSDGWLKPILTLSTKHDSLLISGATCAILSCVFIYVLIRTQKNKNMLRKISLQGNEIDIFEESEESYFDRYLNEVLYVFENVNADAIVFEDMDRFNSNHIFERLHEVNRLVNIQRSLAEYKKPTLRFIYLIRDDIFISKDRTKFFDYIIPVIPVVDSSNSYDQFISIFEKGEILSLFNEGFLQGLSLYIDDMRILKNIYNEFLVYYNRLNTTELDCNKMLAVIAYKNIFPRDFSELQLNQGMVFTIFCEKENLISRKIERLEADINDRKKEIEAISNEILNSSNEVDAIYDKELSKYNNHPHYYQTEKTDIENRRKCRKENVENKINGKIEKINVVLLKLREDLVDSENRKLKEIITRENIDAVFKITHTNEIGEERDFNEIKSSEYFDLLKYLIRDGYIDETYTDYMTYFYENSLNRIDKMFLRSITDQKGKEFTYQLKNPKLVVARLREVDFEKEEALNFDLLAYLLQTPVHINLIKRLFKQFKEDSGVEFIRDYFETERAQPSFINRLNTLWPEFFSYALKGSEFSADWIKRYSIGTFYYSASNTIETVNIDDCLTNYLSDSADYLAIAEPKVDKLISGFKLLNVSFASIIFESANKELFDEVYKNSLYDINFANLTLMLRKIYQLSSDDDICHKNYTLVMSQPDSPLANYVDSHISDYIDTILSSCNGLIVDEETIVLSVLNHEEISDEQKGRYINSLQTSVTSLSEVENESLWLSLLDKDIAVCSEENIFSYFERTDTLDSTLIEFINRTEAKLDISKAVIEKERKNKLLKVIISCNGITDEKYERLICSFNVYYSSFGITGISDAKFNILVNKSIVRMNIDSLVFIRENYSANLHHYIRKNIDEYISIIDADTFSAEEMHEILSWDVSDEIKIRQLQFVNIPFSVKNKELSTQVNEYILHHNFDINDLPYLSGSYDHQPSGTKEIIFNLTVKNISHVVGNFTDISDELVKALLHTDRLEYQEKIDLFIFILPRLEVETRQSYLDILSLTEFRKIPGRGRPKIEVNETNLLILNAFKSNSIIADFEEDGENPTHYKIIKRRTIFR